MRGTLGNLEEFALALAYSSPFPVDVVSVSPPDKDYSGFAAQSAASAASDTAAVFHLNARLAAGDY